MYDIPTVQTLFFDIIKWRQFDDPNIPPLDTGLTTATTTTGLYYNDINTLLYPENIEKVLKHYDSFEYDAWVAGTDYEINDKVLFNNHAYIAKGDTIGDQPDDSPAKWKSILSQELLRKTNDNTTNVVEQVLNIKKLNGLKPLAEDLRIFEGAGRINDVIIKESRFVGISLALKKYNGLRATINRMGAQFTQINTDLTIYVYHSSQNSAIKTFTISTTETNSFSWNAVSDCMLDYVNYTGYDNGMFFIGYYEDDLTGQAINKEIDFSKEPTGCKGCLHGLHNIYSYNLYNKYVTIRPFSVTPNGTDMFDIDDITYYCDHNFGLNFHITIECDITTLLTDNKDRFKDVLRKQMAVDILKDLAYTVRENVIEKRVRDNAFTELKGVDNRGGMERQLEKAYEAIDLVMTIDSPCMGKKKRGIKSGAF